MWSVSIKRHYSIHLTYNTLHFGVSKRQKKKNKGKFQKKKNPYTSNLKNKKKKKSIGKLTLKRWKQKKKKAKRYFKNPTKYLKEN